VLAPPGLTDYRVNDDSFSRMTTTTTEPDVARAAKRERILRAAADVFARTGYFNAKVSEVAKAAGIADGTIYLYFAGKEDLLVTIFREQTRNYLIGLSAVIDPIDDPQEKMQRAIAFHLQNLGRDRSLAVVFQVELRHSLKFMALFSSLEVAEYLNVLRSLVEYGQSRGAFRPELNAQLIAKSIFGILDEMVTSWVLSEKEYRLEDHAEPVADFVLHGLRA
jgi:TetR/AcrR family fatty acid metabolism transcriptional regulator